MKPDLTDREKIETVDGRGTVRDDLEILKITDNIFWIIHVPTETVLCQSWRSSYRFKITKPLDWKSYNDADKWVRSGCIGELQELLCNLDVGFKNGHLTTY